MDLADIPLLYCRLRYRALHIPCALVGSGPHLARRHDTLVLSGCAAPRSSSWRFGASLHRLLPVVALNKEFEDFFDNPAPAHVYELRNLNRFQAAFFSGLLIAGWVLGFFLIAALGGLMPKG